MTQSEFNKLTIGDTIRHIDGFTTYVVTGNFGGRVTAVTSVYMSDPKVWVHTKPRSEECECEGY